MVGLVFGLGLVIWYVNCYVGISIWCLWVGFVALILLFCCICNWWVVLVACWCLGVSDTFGFRVDLISCACTVCGFADYLSFGLGTVVCVGLWACTWCSWILWCLVVVFLLVLFCGVWLLGFVWLCCWSAYGGWISGLVVCSVLVVSLFVVDCLFCSRLVVGLMYFWVCFRSGYFVLVFD